ncbi:MAG: elongation factor P [Kiritimatiellae bacterium]|nr:elongation factor P [Kiritimatiellia bacterium]
MYGASDLRKGLKVEINGVPYVITEFQFVKPGKGQALYNCRLKSLLDGATMSRTYRSNDKIDEPKLAEKDVHFSYTDGAHYVFLDENYEQVEVPGDVLGDARYFLTEELPVTVLYHNGRPVAATLPTFVEKEIVQTEPGARGDTATNVLKPATIDTGYQVQVPLFINEGDIIKIDTRTGEYSDRVRKK